MQWHTMCVALYRYGLSLSAVIVGILNWPVRTRFRSYMVDYIACTLVTDTCTRVHVQVRCMYRYVHVQLSYLGHAHPAVHVTTSTFVLTWQHLSPWELWWEPPRQG